MTTTLAGPIKVGSYPVFSENGRLVLREGTPVAEVKATGTLTLSGAVSHGETVTIGPRAYHFSRTAADAENPDALLVDVSAGTKAQASGTLTFSGAVTDGECVTIHNKVYEFDYDNAVGTGHVKVDVSANAVAASGTLTLGDLCAAGDTFTIGTEVYELTTDGTFTEGNIPVNVKDVTTAAGQITALVAVISARTALPIVAADGVADTLTITYNQKGVIGNALATTSTATNAAWGAATLASGADCPAANAITALASAIDITGLTDADGEGDTLTLAAAAAGAFDGSLGNAVVTLSTCENATWSAETLEGGSDATAAEAVTALVTTITADDSAVVTVEDGTGDTVKATAKVAGAGANSYATTTTCSAGAWAKATLEGGVTGTAGLKGEMIFAEGFIYVCTADTTSGTAWKKATLASL